MESHRDRPAHRPRTLGYRFLTRGERGSRIDAFTTTVGGEG
jgi:hypothetical protein